MEEVGQVGDPGAGVVTALDTDGEDWLVVGTSRSLMLYSLHSLTCTGNTVEQRADQEFQTIRIFSGPTRP